MVNAHRKQSDAHDMGTPQSLRMNRKASLQGVPSCSEEELKGKSFRRNLANAVDGAEAFPRQKLRLTSLRSALHPVIDLVTSQDG